MKIKIDYINGQSMFTRKIFRGTFLMGTDDNQEIIDTIVSIVKGGYFTDDENIYLNCDNEKLKMGIIMGVCKANPKMNFVLNEMICGNDFGYNVSVSSKVVAEERHGEITKPKLMEIIDKFSEKGNNGK